MYANKDFPQAKNNEKIGSSLFFSGRFRFSPETSVTWALKLAGVKIICVEVWSFLRPGSGEIVAESCSCLLVMLALRAMGTLLTGPFRLLIGTFSRIQ